MENTIKIEKNQEYTINITGMGSEGEGIGRINNFAVFVKGALTGEKVKVKVTKVSKNFAFAHLLKVIEASKNRLSPECGLHKRCGGCQFQHVSYNGQLEFKEQRVVDAVTRIGKLEGVVVHPVIGMENPYRYRNKVQLPVARANGKVKIGFYAPRTHDVIDMESCLIQDEVGDDVIKITRNWINKYNISTYDESKGEGIIRHIMIRKGFRTGEVMVVVVTNGRKLPFYMELIEDLRNEIKGLKSVVQNINSKKTNVILGQESKTLWGEDIITDYIGEFKFNISPLSFFQVNPIQTEVLYNKALEYANLTGDEIVFDAYCGTGTISLFLSQKARKVYGVEVVPQAIDNAWENAEQNNVKNVEFIVGESERIIPELIKKGISADVVVVDPPRKGCEKELLLAIAKMEPKRIVYVSCDPGTLARDLKILNDLNYKVQEIQPVDMFPQTSHVETCVLLYNKEYYDKEIKGKVKAEVVTEV